MQALGPTSTVRAASPDPQEVRCAPSRDQLFGHSAITQAFYDIDIKNAFVLFLNKLQ